MTSISGTSFSTSSYYSDMRGTKLKRRLWNDPKEEESYCIYWKHVSLQTEGKCSCPSSRDQGIIKTPVHSFKVQQARAPKAHNSWKRSQSIIKRRVHLCVSVTQGNYLILYLPPRPLPLDTLAVNAGSAISKLVTYNKFTSFLNFCFFSYNIMIIICTPTGLF